MDSVNKNQPEENHENLSAGRAAMKIKELVEQAKSCFFCTNNATGESDGVRPMSIQKIDDDGIMWFLSPADSHKNLEINMNSDVQLYFQGSTHSDFLHIKGKAIISRDKNKIEELWEPTLKTWFTEGKDDPRISVIQVIPEDGYYWDTKHGNAVAGLKILYGSIVGKTYDDSIEGRVSL